MTLDDAIETARNDPAAYVVADSNLTYLYKGCARQLVARLKDHRSGRVSRTKNHRPLSVVYFEYCTTYSEALAREKYLKSGVGREWLKEYLSETTQG